MSFRHKGTGQVVAILTTLTLREGWATVAELSAELNLHRDTVRAVLEELSVHGWAQHREEGDLFTIGAELPRLGLHQHNALARRAAALRAELDHLCRPLTLETP